MTQTQEDVAKIEAYRKTLGKYPKPSVTADIVAVRPTYSELGEGQWPFEGSGRCRAGSSARRKLWTRGRGENFVRR